MILCHDRQVTKLRFLEQLLHPHVRLLKGAPIRIEASVGISFKSNMRYSTHNVPIWPYGLQVLAPPKVQNSKSEADQPSVREATYQNFIQQAKLLICKYIYTYSSR